MKTSHIAITLAVLFAAILGSAIYWIKANNGFSSYAGLPETAFTINIDSDTEWSGTIGGLTRSGSGSLTIEINSAATSKDKGGVIIDELKKVSLVPESLSLQEIIIDNEGVIYLNFTKDLLQGAAGKSDDTGTVYAIVNSFLASFRYTKKVQLLVDWKPVYTLRGTVYTYLPIEFNKQVMED